MHRTRPLRAIEEKSKKTRRMDSSVPLVLLLLESFFSLSPSLALYMLCMHYWALLLVATFFGWSKELAPSRRVCFTPLHLYRFSPPNQQTEVKVAYCSLGLLGQQMHGPSRGLVLWADDASFAPIASSLLLRQAMKTQ